MYKWQKYDTQCTFQSIKVRYKDTTQTNMFPQTNVLPYPRTLQLVYPRTKSPHGEYSSHNFQLAVKGRK